MGWGIVRRVGSKLSCVDFGVLAPGDARPVPERLGALLGALETLVAAQRPDALAIEAAFVRENARTALVLGQARGLALAVASRAGLPVFEYEPALVKRTIVGTGRAEKAQMQAMVKVLLGLDAEPPEDAADALAVAVMHAHASALPLGGHGGHGMGADAAAAGVSTARARYLALVSDSRKARKGTGSSRDGAAWAKVLQRSTPTPQDPSHKETDP